MKSMKTLFIMQYGVLQMPGYLHHSVMMEDLSLTMSHSKKSSPFSLLSWHLFTCMFAVMNIIKVHILDLALCSSDLTLHDSATVELSKNGVLKAEGSFFREV